MINIFKRLRVLERKVGLHEDYLKSDGLGIAELRHQNRRTLTTLESWARYTSTIPGENKQGLWTRKKVSKKKLEEHLSHTEPLVTTASTEDF